MHELGWRIDRDRNFIKSVEGNLTQNKIVTPLLKSEYESIKPTYDPLISIIAYLCSSTNVDLNIKNTRGKTFWDYAQGNAQLLAVLNNCQANKASNSKG